MLEMLAVYGHTRDDRRLRQAMPLILTEREPDGSLFGCWGDKYFYGSFLVQLGLDAIGLELGDPVFKVRDPPTFEKSVENF